MGGLAAVGSQGAVLPPVGDSGDLITLPAFAWAVRWVSETGYDRFGYITFDSQFYHTGLYDGSWSITTLRPGSFPNFNPGAVTGWYYLTGTSSTPQSWNLVGNAPPAGHKNLFYLDQGSIQGTFDGSDWPVAAPLPGSDEEAMLGFALSAVRAE